MKPCTLHFKVKENGTFAPTFYYSYNPEAPLYLRSDVAAGDVCDITLTDAHIALYVNGNLTDEEWPCGNLDFSRLQDEYDFTVTDGAVNPALPQRTGISAEALRLPGVHVGDCMPFSGTDGRYHLYWLYDRHHHTSKWGRGAHQWAHASTDDLVHWNEHPMAVAITQPYEGSICTGSTIAAEGKHYCWYAIRMTDGSPARITYSVSDDGFHYEKSDVFFTLPDCYHGPSARDPKVICMDGKYHMFVTTTRLETGCGCLAHLISDHADMKDCIDLGPIMEWKNGDQPECPDYFAFGGKYYLVWSICGRAHYAYADTPFGEEGWSFAENILDCGSVPKAAVCPWNGELVFTGFVGEGGYAGHILMKRAVQAEDGVLTLYDL